jgi:23S rRNA pseudouridine2605 synthase
MADSLLNIIYLMRNRRDKIGEMKTVRLQKFIAECGVASRRKAEELIKNGEIKVNGRLVTELGTKIDPARDKVFVSGRPIKPEEKKVYIKVNKPRGYVSSCVSQRGERTVIDLVKAVPYRLFPIGRLDYESEGLMLLTNDGELANRLMHPRYEHEKEYVVDVTLPLTPEALRQIEAGVVIDGEKTLPAKVRKLGEKSFSIVLREGRKRQIRLMVGKIGNIVIKLKRVRIGNIRLGELEPGECCYLTPNEISKL